MKKLLLLLFFLPCIALGQTLDLPGRSQNRYSEDEVTRNGNYCIKSDGTPVNGIVYSENKNGQLEEEINYIDGEKDGLWRKWYTGGKLHGETNFKDGKPDGLWREWDGNGQKEKTYKDGKLISYKRWDRNGILTRDKTY